MSTPNPLPRWPDPLRRFLARRGTQLLALAILVTWWAIVLREQLPVLLAMLSAAAAAVWLARHRTDLAAAVAVAAATALLPAAAMLTVLHHDPTATDAAAVLIGYCVAGPVPTLCTWALRPAALHRTRTALTGSAVMLAGAAAAAAAGGPIAATLLPVTVITVASGTWMLNRRRRCLTSDRNVRDIGDGWFDFGSRATPSGLHVQRLLLGRGHGIAAWPTDTEHPGRVVLESTVRHAATVADTIGVPTARIQPVLLAPVHGLPRRHLVTTQDLAAVVIVANPDQLTALTAAAPRRPRYAGRRARHVAAALPAPEPRRRRPVMA